MSEETQGTTCKKCGQDKKSCSTCNQKKELKNIKESKTDETKKNEKSCKTCNKAVRQIMPYLLVTVLFTFFLAVGVYDFVKYIIGLFSN